jgi:hypothetical protein
MNVNSRTITDMHTPMAELAARKGRSHIVLLRKASIYNIPKQQLSIQKQSDTKLFPSHTGHKFRTVRNLRNFVGFGPNQRVSTENGPRSALFHGKKQTAPKNEQKNMEGGFIQDLFDLRSKAHLLTQQFRRQVFFFFFLFFSFFPSLASSAASESKCAQSRSKWQRCSDRRVSEEEERSKNRGRK